MHHKGIFPLETLLEAEYILFQYTFCPYTLCRIIPFVRIRCVALYLLSVYVLLHQTFCPYTFCCIIPYVIFDVLSVYVLSLQTFCRYTFCHYTLCPFDVLSLYVLSLDIFVSDYVKPISQFRLERACICTRRTVGRGKGECGG